MSHLYLASLRKAEVVPFTAGDLVEGLVFMELPFRRATLFGLEQSLSSPGDVIDMTYTKASTLELTSISTEILKQTPRHIRLQYVFWQYLQDGMLAPLFDLEGEVQVAFGGMLWSDLLGAYKRMIWVDEVLDTEHFIRTMRENPVL